MSSVPVNTLRYVIDHPLEIESLIQSKPKSSSFLWNTFIFVLLVVIMGLLGWVLWLYLKPQPPVAAPTQPVKDVKENTTTPLKAKFYADCNFQGTMAELGVGDYDMNSMIIANDMLSSAQVPSGLKVTLFEDSNFKGAVKVLTSDNSCLTDFNDKASSIRIEKV